MCSIDELAKVVERLSSFSLSRARNTQSHRAHFENAFKVAQNEIVSQFVSVLGSMCVGCCSLVWCCAYCFSLHLCAPFFFQRLVNHSAAQHHLDRESFFKLFLSKPIHGEFFAFLFCFSFIFRFFSSSWANALRPVRGGYHRSLCSQCDSKNFANTWARMGLSNEHDKITEN